MNICVGDHTIVRHHLTLEQTLMTVTYHDTISVLFILQYKDKPITMCYKSSFIRNFSEEERILKAKQLLKNQNEIEI